MAREALPTLELGWPSRLKKRKNNDTLSAELSSKATRPLTRPRSSEVVCKGFTPMREWNCHAWPRLGRVTQAEGSIG
jgi:hypothetical protein